LREVLELARATGFLGPGPVETHLVHAAGFAEAAQAALGREPGNFADLGTGGGVPGLVLATLWAAARGVFVESNQRRADSLRDAVARLGLEDRIEVLEERAEAVGRSPEYRGQFSLATARSFAEPAATAEIAAGLVGIQGVVVVSEPPESEKERWPAVGLHQLGFGPAEPVICAHAHFVVIRKTEVTPERFPRRVGIPAKRPLW
jgi:16S rRNA (guanine527-N7)-methyltransferase